MKKVPVKKKNEYKASIKVQNKVYTSTGETLKEAISKLEVKNCKGVGILTVTKGDKTKDKIIVPSLVFRLFNTYGVSREITLKNVISLFDL